MAYPKKNLTPILECDDEDGNHTCWAVQTEKMYSGRYHYIWISLYSDGYRVENSHGYNLADDKVYKTLGGAKRKAEEVIFLQEEHEFFTN
jgi:hypothetical protein